MLIFQSSIGIHPLLQCPNVFVSNQKTVTHPMQTITEYNFKSTRISCPSFMMIIQFLFQLFQVFKSGVGGIC